MSPMYLATEIMSIVIMLILLYANVFEVRQHTKKTRIFSQLLILNELVVIADAITWLPMAWKDVPALFGFLLSLTYILPFFVLATFSRYIYVHLSNKARTAKKPFIILDVCCVVAGIVALILCAAGKIFVVKDGKYYSGELEIFYYLFYVLALLFLTGVILSNRKKLGIHDLIAALSFCVLPLMIIGLSATVLGVNMSVPCMSVYILIIYVLLQSERESHLYRQSNTDELTGLLNRRAYEEDIANNDFTPALSDCVYISVDVNGLKQVNDTLGHGAGDELIQGAAQCLKRTLGNYGRVYRTGGDEFTAIITTDEEKTKSLIADLEANTLAWHGKIVDSLAFSVGYVGNWEYPQKSIGELAKIADERMYLDKELYYSQKGVDRRGQSEAHKVLCSLYTKILKINLTTDTFSIINMEPAEQDSVRGFSEKISQWLEHFGRNGFVHPEDLDIYLAKTNPEYIRSYFRKNKTSLTILYRRKHGDAFKRAMMEIIPAGDYTQENQSLFLYVKDFDM